MQLNQNHLQARQQDAQLETGILSFELAYRMQMEASDVFDLSKEPKHILDDFGFKAVVDPVHVHDLQATILRLMGFDHERFTFRYAGRDFRLTDVHGKVVKDIIV